PGRLHPRCYAGDPRALSRMRAHDRGEARGRVDAGNAAPHGSPLLRVRVARWAHVSIGSIRGTRPDGQAGSEDSEGTTTRRRELRGATRTLVWTPTSRWSARHT